MSETCQNIPHNFKKKNEVKIYLSETYYWQVHTIYMYLQ